MTNEHNSISDTLKRLGFEKNNKIRLYGEEFDLLSDRRVLDNGVIMVDAVVRKSGAFGRLSVPLVVQMLRNEHRAA